MNATSSRPAARALLAAVVLTLVLAAPASARRTLTPHIAHVRCVPAAQCRAGVHAVARGGTLQLTGRRLVPGLAVVFPRHAGKRRPGHVRARLARTRTGLLVVVPATAVSGRIYVVRGGRRSNAAGPIRIVAPPRTPVARPAPAPTPASTATAAALDGQGMWIWQLEKSSGGDLDAIAAQARASGVTTIFLKSSDGGGTLWPQFSPATVQGLQARGLHVCAWQFVYGTHPDQEAALGAQAQANGAECLIADVEDQYDGKYAAAQTYIRDLRATVGPDYSVGVTSFPYLDYHPSLPISVFLGPSGAQSNLPQMYWKDIGTSVDAVYGHTYVQNGIYARPILPLGQTYGNPPAADIVRFRRLAANYGAAGLSFFSWQETTADGWNALAQPAPAVAGFAPVTGTPLLKKGSKGDEVVWLQEHLAADQPGIAIDGEFGGDTAGALAAFQSKRGLPATGQTDDPTWQALLQLQPVAVTWTSGSSTATTARARRGTRLLPPPRSATLPSRDELRGAAPGRG